MIPYLIAAALGWKLGPPVVDKIKSVLHIKPDFDANMPSVYAADVSNLLANVRDPVLLEAAAADYAARGFPIAAQALAQRGLAVSKIMR